MVRKTPRPPLMSCWTPLLTKIDRSSRYTCCKRQVGRPCPRNSFAAEPSAERVDEDSCTPCGSAYSSSVKGRTRMCPMKGGLIAVIVLLNLWFWPTAIVWACNKCCCIPGGRAAERKKAREQACFPDRTFRHNALEENRTLRSLHVTDL